TGFGFEVLRFVASAELSFFFKLNVRPSSCFRCSLSCCAIRASFSLLAMLASFNRRCLLPNRSLNVVPLQKLCGAQVAARVGLRLVPTEVMLTMQTPTYPPSPKALRGLDRRDVCRCTCATSSHRRLPLAGAWTSA